MSDDVISADLVSEVTKVGINETKDRPPHLIVHAEGTVPTGGWTHVRLTRPIEIVQPIDGIVDFELVADRPTGIVDQMVHTVHAKSEPFVRQEWMKGVRVRAAHDSKEARL